MGIQLVQSPLWGLLAIISGTVFGFLLEKGGVSRSNAIIRQLILKDYTVMKIIMTAILVGGAGVYFLYSLGVIEVLQLSKTPLMLAIGGGGIFGVGMGMAGYCPGTSVAALSNGSKEVLNVVFGMFVGAALFNECSSFLMPLMKRQDGFYQETAVSYLSVSPLLVLSLLGLGLTALAYFTRSKAGAKQVKS